MVEFLFLITELVGQTANRAFRTHAVNHVTDLETQMLVREKGHAGGPLIVAILLGYYGPNFKLITYTTASANLMLREMGIALFLASVGLAAGRPFVDAIVEGNGLLYAFLGLFITIIPLVVIGSIARKVYKMNYHSIVGMIAGATTDPPTLAYASTLTEKNVSAVAYSTVYPLAMFLRILSGQFVLLILWQFVS